MTKKQMGVIYKAYKEGKLPRVSAEDIKQAYSNVEYLERHGYDFCRFHHESYELTKGLKKAVDAIFAGDYETADDVVRNFESVKWFD